MPVRNLTIPDDELTPTAMSAGAEVQEDGEGFEPETIRAMRRINGALRDLVDAIPGEIRRPIDLQRALSLDSKLCWQVFKIIKPEQLLASAQHVPGTPSLNRLLAASEAANVPSSTIDGVRTAIDLFNETVALHAPDRSAFDSMVTAASDESSSSVDLFHRRNAYRSESHIWGVQVESYIVSNFIHPSADGVNKDECHLVARVGHRRLRSDAPLVVLRSATRALNKVLAHDSRQPIDLDAYAKYNAPLLPEFSSSPMPPLTSTNQEGGWTQIEVGGNAVGQQAAMSFAFGTVNRNLPFTRNEQGRRMFSESVRFITPAGMLVMDMLVHRPSYGTIDPELIVFPRVDGVEPPTGYTGHQRLPVRESIQPIPINTPAMAIPEFKKYPELLRWTCRRMDWNLSEFDLYRLRLPFPVLNSICRIHAVLRD